MFGLKDLLFSPEDGVDSISGSTGLSEDLALLNDEEIQTPPETHGEEVVEEEVEEEQETDEQRQAREEEEEEISKPHELAPHDRPTYTDLKAYDPELFKEFPGLKDVIFREKAYTELFSNIEDAKTAIENATAFDNSRNSIFEGDGTTFISSIKETDPKALTHFAERILPALYKVDQEAHWKAANPILESMARGFYNTAKDEDTKKAALLFAEFMFGDDGKDIVEGKKTFIPKIEETKVDPERVQFLKERHDAFRGDVITNINTTLMAMIDSKNKDGKPRIDPEAFSPWMKKTLVEKIATEIKNQMDADKSHMDYMDGLWKKAGKNAYKAEWKTRIIDAFLARARQLVPVVRSQIVSEALGTQSRRAGKTRERVRQGGRPEAGTGGRPGGGGTGKLDSSKKIDYSKTSDEDLINDNITYR